MEPTEARIAVTIPHRAKATVLVLSTRLAFIPPAGTVLTVECGDEPLPLEVGHASYNLSTDRTWVSTTVPNVERELPGGRTQRLEPPEIISMLLSGGFVVEEIWTDEKLVRRTRRGR
jgi:hypothetical protein